jgi:hypothetical protein
MNWMIDGAYGDLYRKSMGFPELAPAVDEWEVERNIHRKSPPIRPSTAERARTIAARARAAIQIIRLALTSREMVS